MKRLTCEMCGSTDIIKQNGLFVCQHCETKYSVEDAKKMMIEGTVDVSGSTVKVDTSEELKNLFQLARRAKNDDNAESAINYYGMILLKEPTSWEATFYFEYYKAMNCKASEIYIASSSLKNCLDNVMQFICDHVEQKDKQIENVCEIAEKCYSISTLLNNFARKTYGNYENIDKMQNYCYATAQIMYTLGDCIDTTFGDYYELHEIAVKAWKDGINKHNTLSMKGKSAIIEKYTAKIQKYDSSYYVATRACYIATAVYGSYDCPQVWTLRRFRDNTLAKKRLGRSFIKLYYSISPIAVKHLGSTGWVKAIWKKILDRMVEKLNAKGIENTPYNDE